MPVPAIVLAAGASRRLGQPKQMVRVNGETLLARTIRVVRESGADPVLVVLGANRESIAETVDLSAVEVIANPHWEQGIASSIHAGIEALMRLRPDAHGMMILVCDQPNLAAGHLKQMIEVFEQAAEPTIIASRYARIVGIPAIFPGGQFAKLLALAGDTGARSLLRHPDCPMIAVDFEGGEADVDTPEDLARAISSEL